MIPEIDVRRAASFPVRRYGADAELEAAHLADVMLDPGDCEGRLLWLRIKQATETLYMRDRMQAELSTGCSHFKGTRVLKRDCTLSSSFVEIRRSFGLIGQTNQRDSTRDHRPTNYNSKRHDCRMYNSCCSDKRHYPDNDADNTKTSPDHDFHLDPVLLMAQTSTKGHHRH